MTEPDERLDALQKRIESILLGGSRQYTRAEVAQRSGVPPERATALWRALGFATASDDAAVFTEGDIQALRIANELIQAGIIEPAVAISSARMIGQHMSRLAESQVLMLRDVVAANPELADERQLGRLVEHLAPDMERLQDFVWRRHLAAYSVRMLVASDEELDERRQVVGFADMVGFTTLTRRSTEAELVAVVDRFDALAAEVVADNHGRIVKMLGDEVLFVADSPADGAEIALTLLERADADEDLPPLRVGLALGRVLNRFGDVYGSVVNIASRLTSIARPGTVLVDRELSDTLAEATAYTVRHRRPTSVRGYARLRSASLRRAGPDSPKPSESAIQLVSDFLTEPTHLPLEPDDDHPRRRRRR
ncbi:MAG TPA: adenylate/guanylate cyclase domain-containing protein [Actinophytocola sp.]|nr:adenylate/guanylate cyclase domain-containing protein [Actinophytocola sp.]